MELKQIKELMAAMGRTGTKRLTLKKEGFELQLEREENGGLYRGPEELLDDPSVELSRRTNIALSRAKESESSLISSLKPSEEKGNFVTSPMVGTYYAAPSPEAPFFVKVGDKIEKNTVVCIIEAMKVMNEVKANVSGTVAEVLVDSGHPVEFGTKLYRIV